MDHLRKIILDITNRIERLERNLTLNKLSIPSSGYFVPKVLTSDPASPQTNEVWINSTSNQLKWYTGTTIKTITFT